MTRFTILVDFRLKPGTSDRFRRLIEANARASARDEPGCRQFDVFVPRGEEDRVMLYEVYDDEASFQKHLRTSHYAAFERDSEAMIESSAVIAADLVFAGGGSANPE